REFNFFEVDAALCTGSSIMPQKQNVDTAELLRARYATLCGCEQAIKMNTVKLTSGYHRDLQLIKKEVMTSLVEIKAMLEMAQLLAEHLIPNEKQLKAACTKEIFAADRANELVKKGLIFRDAYHKVKSNMDEIEAGDLMQRLKEKKHVGGPGNLGLDSLKKEIEMFHL